MIKFIQFFVWLFGRLIWRLIFRLEVVNREVFKNCPAKGLVFYSNHASYFDAFLVSTNIPLSYYFRFKGFRFLTKRHHICRHWYGAFIRAMGAYPLPKDKKGYEQVMPETVEIVRQGYVVVVFPIPTLEKDIDPAQARPGLSYLAKKTGAVLLPIRVENTFASSLKDLFRRRCIHLVYGQPISNEEFSRLPGDYQEKSRQLMERVASLGK